MATKVVAKKVNTAVVEGNGVIEGLEDLGGEDLMIPTIVLLQEKSFLRKYTNEDGEEAKHDAGLFINGLDGKVYKSLEFVPVRFMKYWDLLDEDPKMPRFVSRVFTADHPSLNDGSRRFFSNNGKKANVKTVLCWFALVEGQPVKITFSVGSHNAGKQLNSIIASKKVSPWLNKYKLTAVINPKNDNYVPSPSYVGETTQEDRDVAVGLYRSIQGNKPKAVGEEEVPF